MKFIPLAAVLLAAMAVGHTAAAQGLTAVKPLAGYVCMRLNLTREQMLDNSLSVPVFAHPSSTSPKIGEASATVITKSPMESQNGFAEILFPDGRPAWIQVNMLVPFRNSLNPTAHCTPSLLSNGKPGLG